MARPRLWIAYDFVDSAQCLEMLDRIVAEHPNREIIHEIGRPTLLNAVLQGCRIVQEFRKRLAGGQTLVVDFKGFDVPYSVEGKYFYEAGADLVTVMAMAPDEAIDEALDGARQTGRLVAFDLMAHTSDHAKAQRALQLAQRGAQLVSCHTGWNEQAAGKSSEALLDLVHRQLLGTGAQMIAMGGVKPVDVPALHQYASSGTLYAVVAGASITRADDPAAVVGQFLAELDMLPA